MKKDNDYFILKRALNEFGIQIQMVILMEECAELQKAVAKALRSGSGRNDIPSDIIEEIADVEIMIEQLRIFYEDAGDLRKFVDSRKKVKMKRLNERVMNRVKEHGAIR